MGKSYFEESEEAKGGLTKSLTGALVEIVSFERTKTGENSKTPGTRMYVEEVKIVEPKRYKDLTVRDWIVVGTAEDPLAKRPETWGRSEAGPGRLKRVLNRSGTPLSDDDEEWMEAAEGKQYVTPITVRADDSGQPRARLGLAYRPSDEDCPEIGEASGEEVKPGKPAKAKGATAAAKKLRGSKPAKEDDEDEKPAKKGKPADDDDSDDDEKPSKSSKKSKADDDDDDEDDD